MAKVPTVYLAVRADTGQVKKSMSEAQKAFLGFQKSLKGSRRGSNVFANGMKQIAMSAIGVTAGLGAIGLAIRKLVGDISKMQTMTIQLETATGSVGAAQIKFKELVQTASELPVSIQDVTKAFIKLQNMGLDPTKNTIVSFTNTASALGKTLQQFVEAVADAGTREFERLKEFGIMTRNEGENIRFIFQKNETVVKNTTDNIVKYLTSLGNVEFAGAATKQMQTISGAANNLGDAFFQLNTALGEDSGGLIQAMLEQTTHAVKLTAKAVSSAFFDSDLKNRIAEINKAAGGGLGNVELFAAAFKELGEVDLEDVEARMLKLMEATKGLGADDDKTLKQQLMIDELAEIEKAYQRIRAEQIAGWQVAKDKLKLKQDEAEQKLRDISVAQGQAALDKIALEWVIKESGSRLLIELEIAKAKEAQAEAERKLKSASMGTIFSVEEIARIVAEYDNLTGTLNSLDKALEDLDKKAIDYRKQMQGFGEDIKRGFADAIVEGENLQGVLRNVLKEIAKSALLRAIGGFAMPGIGGAAGTAGSGILGGIGKAFSGGKATGGPVSANRSYMVGEKGPELFTPSGAGSITPNHRSGGGGGTNVSVVNNFAIDGGDKQEIQGMIAQSVSASVSLAVAKMADNKRRRA